MNMARLTKKQRKDYLARHPSCVECGQPAQEVHHIKMVIEGGSNDESNLKALCKQCHADTDDHAMCVGRMVFSLDEHGGLRLKEDGEGG
jgi:hypothetical protein